MIIAIDGPAGTGKTTVSKILAKRLNISYLDTGATYRSLTLKALDNGVDLSNKDVLIDLAKTLNLQIKGEKVYLEGVDVNFMIRTPVIDKNISLIVSYPEVRQIMVELQRKLAKTGDYVVEGRDITTVVFPQAEFKFYLDGDTAVRAQRRYN
ncbi:MAG: (d)CMP kinase, partial [Candidatus Omnitrophica bacterium]|nr:(d)CMP kinase [Candidatus Omnitrophota bacterium]